MGNVFFGGGKVGMTAPVGGLPVSSLAVGTKVKMNVNGTARNFIIVNQGIPSNSTLYDDSCDGVWLMMEDLYTKIPWDSSDNDYANSDIHAYLNNTFLNLLDSNVRSVIKNAKIPYWKGTGSGGSVSSGANGLSTQVFLLSGYEVGWTTNFPVDGACLDYFSGCSATDSKRIGYYNGTATFWWLRSPSIGATTGVWLVNNAGAYFGNTYSYYYAVRPCFILPSDTLFEANDDGTVTLKVSEVE